MSTDLTTKQVAAKYKVLDATVRLWRRRGLFPNAYEYETPRGSVWMIPESDLKDFQPPELGRPPKAKVEIGKVSKKGGKSAR